MIERQLAVFREDNAAFLREVDEADRAQRDAERDEAEAAFETYSDLVETGTELLADLRDGFASTLDEAAREAYEAEFNRAVRKRLPPFGVEIDLR